MDTPYTGRVSRVVGLLQRKWTVRILSAMRTRPVRLSELKRAIPSASKKHSRRVYDPLKLHKSFCDET
jgi:DNA-binding HxlR family transcriptional regulator